MVGFQENSFYKGHSYDWYERIVLLIHYSGLKKSELNSYQEVLEQFLLYKNMSIMLIQILIRKFSLFPLPHETCTGTSLSRQVSLLIYYNFRFLRSGIHDSLAEISKNVSQDGRMRNNCSQG